MNAPKTSEWHEERRKYLGASDANIIMGGTAQQRLDLWKVKTGAAEPESLDDVFPVQLGTFTEPFNLAWFQRKTGWTLTGQQERIVHANGWMACTPDGLLEDAIVEAKHVSARFSMADTIAKYQPQLHHSMIVTGRRKAFLSVISGNEYDYAEIEFNDEYAAKLMEVEADFWECVTYRIPPSDAPPNVAPPEPFRVVSMVGNNEWASCAAEWLANKTAARAFDTAAAGIKSLVGADVKAATGHGISLTRNKRGAATIKESA